MTTLPLPAPTLPTCNFPTLSTPGFPDPIAALAALVNKLGIPIGPPNPPNILPKLPCPFSL